MPTMLKFGDIETWQTARELSRLVYDLKRHGQFDRDFGLSDQMRRSAVPIIPIIAEGFESRTQPLFIDHLGRAKTSAGELCAQVNVANDISYLKQSEFSQLFE
jgi:four helix bundle protein